MTFWRDESNGPKADGIPRERIAVDPGIGFGKTREHNLEILRNLERFANLGCAVMIGVSRKGFLGSITGRPVSERAAATRGRSLEACLRGARVVRVHDVAEMVDAIRVWTALGGWEIGDEPGRADDPIESYRLAEPSSCRTMAEEAKAASRQLAVATGEARNAWLLRSAAGLRQRSDEILAANARRPRPKQRQRA